jgi:hypothetical protein
MGLADFEFDGLGDFLALGVGNGDGEGSGLFGRNSKAARVRGPDFSGGRVKGDGFRVGHVVAELSGLSRVNFRRIDIEAADGKFGATELLDGDAVLFAFLVGDFAGFLPGKSAIAFVARDNGEGNIGGNGQDDNGGVEKRIFQGGLIWRLRIRIHGASRIMMRISMTKLLRLEKK